MSRILSFAVVGFSAAALTLALPARSDAGVPLGFSVNVGPFSGSYANYPVVPYAGYGVAPGLYAPAYPGVGIYGGYGYGPAYYGGYGRRYYGRSYYGGGYGRGYYGGGYGHHGYGGYGHHGHGGYGHHHR